MIFSPIYNILNNAPYLGAGLLCRMSVFGQCNFLFYSENFYLDFMSVSRTEPNPSSGKNLRAKGSFYIESKPTTSRRIHEDIFTSKCKKKKKKM